MYKNMKIEITDKVHLKAVCDVLESMGYDDCRTYTGKKIGYIVAFDDYKTFTDYFNLFGCDIDLVSTTLSDLLRMRDDMVKGKNDE